MTEETRPSERAMKAAVEMEIHAAVSSTTLAKGAAIDKYFPAYDDLLEALKAVLATGLNGGNNVRLSFIAARGKELTDELLEQAEASERAVTAARTAIAKATGV